MTIKIYEELEQGLDEWFEARCGLLTASEMKLVISPEPAKETRLKKNGEPRKQKEWKIYSDDDKCKSHVYELAAQRISHYVEPTYLSDDMMRGNLDEILARDLYSENYKQVKEVGFVTNDKWGFTLGWSPDGLIGKGGSKENKSRRQKFQIETIVTQEVPKEFYIQLQTGLLVSEREWMDYTSYSGGLPMCTIRVYPDRRTQAAILWAARAFYRQMNAVIAAYHEKLNDPDVRLIPTERIIDQGDEIEC